MSQVAMGQVVRRPIALTQGKVLIQVSLFLYLRAFFRKNFSFVFKHPIIKFETKRIEMNFLLKLSDLKSNFTLTLGYLNSALNNAAFNFLAPSLLLNHSSVHHSFKRFFEKFF